MDRVFPPRLSTAGFEFDLGGLTRAVRRYSAVARERRALQGLDARMLRDIGIDRTDALAEAARPFWDAPPGR